MFVDVNGRRTELPEGSTVSDLLRTLGHPSDRVAVEIDGDICPRASHGCTVLKDGQKVEVVSFVGGG